MKKSFAVSIDIFIFYNDENTLSKGIYIYQLKNSNFNASERLFINHCSL